MAEFKDFIQIENDGKLYEGIFIKQDGDFIVLKLSSGYNISLPASSKLEIIKKNSQNNSKEIENLFSHSSDKKNILILHTGGTIASKVDYATGGVISKITPEELLNMFSLMHKYCNFDTKLLAAMWSEDMRFDHYNLIAEEIKLAVENHYDGVIITHGTDTLHYTSAALSFMFEDLTIPVVIVGAQRSSDRGSSDAYINMAAASKFLSTYDKSGIFICMHKNESDNICHILKGVNVRKMHTTFRGAFRQINSIELASVNVIEDKISKTYEFEKYNYYKKIENKLIKLNTNLKIGILYIHPNMHIDEFEMYNNFDALIICSVGIGNMPINEIDNFTINHNKFYDWIKNMSQKIPIIFTAQTIYGRINQNVYSTGRKLSELNIAGHLMDTTIETAFCKIAYLLSKNIDLSQILELYNKNLKGEIDNHINKDSFLR